MLRKKSFLLMLAWIFMSLAMSNEILAKDVEVKDLHLKLPFASGTIWETSCVYDDSGECSTHATYARGVINKDRFALDFNHYVYNDKGGRVKSDDLGMSIRTVASGFAEVHTGTTGYGNYVLIYHIGGYVSRYAHLDSITVRDKTWIGRGQEVGKCGGSGGFSPHLHFALYKKSDGVFVPVKPQPMDGYDNFSVSGKKYTSSNKSRSPFMRISDESGFPAFPPVAVDIAWYPSEASCVNAWYVKYNGENAWYVERNNEYVCIADPEYFCQNAYDDLLVIDSDMYSSDDWYELFFGEVDNVDDSSLQCKVR